MDLMVLLFNEFETLDVFGPVEILGKLEDISKIIFVSVAGGLSVSTQQVPVLTDDLCSLPVPSEYILLIPGGIGTRKEMNNDNLLDLIRRLAAKAKFILTVCTGSLLLAKTGLLDHQKATTNKRVYDWVTLQAPEVKWVKQARWVKSGNIYTSSGVSAGMDMALGFIADSYGMAKAEEIAKGIEYLWNRNSGEDVFSELYEPE
jgi:Transcriptional regulator containing an amidase domain and an AraC-type DNA-binding HTH domain